MTMQLIPAATRSVPPPIRVALGLVALGFAVCEVAPPLPDGSCSCWLRDECSRPGKHPVGRAWLKRAIRELENPRAIALRLMFGYGLFPLKGSRMIVIDRDDAEVLLPLPPTLEVHRASADPGRGHYYSALAADVAEDDVPRSFAGGEVRVAESGMVVGPGCLHISGDRYEASGRLGIATRELIDALTAVPQTRSRADDDPGEVEAVLGSRHAYLVRQARKLRGWGRSRDEILTDLLTINEEQCSPPLPETELPRMVAWAENTIPIDARLPVTRRQSPGRPGSRMGEGGTQARAGSRRARTRAPGRRR